MNATNLSSVHSVEFFVFIGFSNEKELFPLPFLLSLLLYFMNVGGNVILLMLITHDRSLHTPMYYFICNLAIMDIAVSTSVAPKVAANFLSEIKTISFWGCITQMGCHYLFTCLQSFVLLLMAYDRYVAICSPLLYPSIMTNVYVLKLMSATWAISLTNISVFVYLVARLPFCASNIIHHVYCDHISTIRLACADISINNFYAIFVSVALILIPFCLIIFSYVNIFKAVFSIAQGEARNKAMNTCTTHLIVVFIAYSTSILSFLSYRLGSVFPDDVRILCGVTYVTFPGAMHPIIYAFRTKEIKQHIVLFVKKGRISP
ncbi:olfactory receptor 52E4-like [Latimeria chalumnae]|uniref:olfactory receptor 52E4-like n=1 Tax=Latimeria chalumnae TaxID=7897 RepID=UPI0003C19BAE|nr:PREDICTED: olfactory receptor 52E4-like [Latimeria chalumnae]|eukprot:XP_006006584.1 PREDICTED: olfactory receptor 52E4-like [Latimeria chalumnae]